MENNLISDENDLGNIIKIRLEEKIKKNVDPEKIDSCVIHALLKMGFKSDVDYSESDKNKLYDALANFGLGIAVEKYRELTKEGLMRIEGELRTVKEKYRESLRIAKREYHESLTSPLPYTIWPGNIGYPLGM